MRGSARGKKERRYEKKKMDRSRVCGLGLCDGILGFPVMVLGRLFACVAVAAEGIDGYGLAEAGR